MTGRGPLAVAALALAVVACSGDDDASPTTTQAPPRTVTTTTTEPTTPETAPDTTAPTTETTPPTLPAEPTTTEQTTPETAPETTAPPDEEQTKQDVIDATVAAWTAFNELLLDPMDDERLSAIARTRTGDALDRAIEVVLQLRLEGRKSVTHPDLPATIRVNRSSVTVDELSGTARVDYCRLGSNITVEIGGNEDGTDLVLDDTINSYLERDTFVLEERVWLKSDGQTMEIFEGATTCDKS